MVMNYNQSHRADTGMLEASVHSAQATHGQLDGIYRQAGQELDAEEAWRRLGLTPMIGQNEIEADLFGLEDARSLNQYALANGVGRLSMWSLNRDQTCPDHGAARDRPLPHAAESTRTRENSPPSCAKASSGDSGEHNRAPAPRAGARSGPTNACGSGHWDRSGQRFGDLEDDLVHRRGRLETDQFA
jgi:hypothetical protein